jgi:hypothetical protein
LLRPSSLSSPDELECGRVVASLVLVEHGGRVMPRQRRPNVPIEAIVGGKIAPERDALRGLRKLEAELNRDFKARIALEQRVAKAHQPLQDALADELGGRAAATAKRLAALQAQRMKQRVARPPLVREQARIFTGSIGATVVPPYNYQWTWSAQNGGARNFVSAGRQNGQIAVDNDTNMNNGSSASCRAAVGIYFRPVVTNGILRVSANPAFTFDWFTLCTLASAHSDAFIGLYIGRYTLAGGFDGAPVDQRISLWDDDSWWFGAGINTGSNSGFPLFAQLNVDNAHWYAIWIWAGANASAAGWGTFSGSGAGADLQTTVPSISWELF